MMNSLCKRSNRIDFVFDMCIDGSVKDSERVRRCNTNPMHLNELGRETKLPVSKDVFWGSSSNKTKLQDAVRCHILEEQNETTELVVSAVGVHGDMKHSKAVLNGCVREVPDSTCT
jgi:hypothetical protein